MRWQIVYDDGTVIRDTDCSPVGIPFDRRSSVMFILQGPEHDRLFNKDNYVWRSDYGCWIECDDFGLKYELMQAAHQIECVIFGSTVPRSRWQEFMHMMDEMSRGN